MKPAIQDLGTLSDVFLATVAAAAAGGMETAEALADRLDFKLRSEEGMRLRPEKRADMKRIIAWLRLNAGVSA